MYKTIIFLIITMISSSLLAQFSWDMERKNLQVLSDSISAKDLSREMKAYSVSLGVRCNYCHDDSKGEKLEQINFASDVKPEKKIAREMIRMTRTINKQFVAAIKVYDKTAISVSCMTCHRGYREPKHLHQVLMEKYAQNGLDSALNIYEDLKDKYFGSFAFDFREGSLNYFGYQIMKSNPDDALVVFEMNAVLFPDSYNVYDSLGEAFLKNDQKEKAILNYQKSLELNPNNKNAQKMLKEITKK